jgi:DUF4097 and DUF4098 domain-containing protein YvlB
MKKSEFLSIIDGELGRFGLAEKDEILSDLNEHFEAAVQAGKTEDDVCDSLGDPKEIAKEFASSLAQTPAPTPAPASASASDMRGNANALQSCIFADTVTAIKTDLLSCNISLKGVDTDKISLDFEGYRGDLTNRFITESKNGVLYVKELPITERYRNSFKRIVGLFVDYNITLNITLPEAFEGSIEAFTGSGNIDAENLKNPRQITLNSGSGCISATDVTSDNDFMFSTRSGNLKAQSCITLADMELHTGSGNIFAGHSKGAIKAKTGSGNVEFLSHSGTISGSIGSGNVKIHTSLLNDEVRCSTGSGNIRIKCAKSLSTASVKTGSGNIELDINALCADVKAQTGSGNIKAYFGRESDVRFEIYEGGYMKKRSALNNVSFIPGKENAKHTAVLRTSSGDVDVVVVGE